MMTRFLLPAFALLTLVLATTADANSSPTSTGTSTTTSADDSDASGCAYGEYRCYNKLAFIYVNTMRMVSGGAELKLGTESMLRAAMQHSARMAAANDGKSVKRAFHQVLDDIDVGCNTTVLGENVVVSHTQHLKNRDTGVAEISDIAALCENRLLGSTSNKRLLLDTYATEMVLGVVIDKAGYVWCTQLFGSGTMFDDESAEAKCAPAGDTEPAAEPEVEATAEPNLEPETSNGHLFKNKWVKVNFAQDSGSSRPVLMHLTYDPFFGHRYCSMRRGVYTKCLTAKESVAVDAAATKQKHVA